MKPEELAFLPWTAMLGRLLVATVLGGVLGFERERRDEAAGLRTHMLVSAAASLFTMLSLSLTSSHADPSRIASQIVVGMGFLGAGTIIRHGSSVRGLTTAASLWAVAAVGMAAGAGWWAAALCATVVLLLVLTGLKRLEQQLNPAHAGRALVVETAPGAEPLPRIMAVLDQLGLSILEVRYSDPSRADARSLQLTVRASADGDLKSAPSAVAALSGVVAARWE